MTVLTQCCTQLQYAIDEPDVPLVWIAKFRENGLRVLDGGDSYLVISFCPWCGSKLPSSLRKEWFAEIESRGIDPFGNNIPADYQNECWYNSNSKYREP